MGKNLIAAEAYTETESLVKLYFYRFGVALKNNLTLTPVWVYIAATMNQKCLKAFGLLNQIRERRGISQRAWASHCPPESGMNQARIYELLKLLQAFEHKEQIDIGRSCTMEKVQALTLSLKYIIGGSDLKKELIEEIRKGQNTKQAVVSLIFAMDEDDATFKEIVEALTKNGGAKK
jgi:hypothetical protein